MGLDLFAVGTDLGMLSTFSRSVFKTFEVIEALVLTTVDMECVEEGKFDVDLVGSVTVEANVEDEGVDEELVESIKEGGV